MTFQLFQEFSLDTSRSPYKSLHTDFNQTLPLKIYAEPTTGGNLQLARLSAIDGSGGTHGEETKTS